MRKNKWMMLMGLSLLLATTACNDTDEEEVKTPVNPPEQTIPQIPFTKQEEYPHDTNAFTEGLLVYEGEIYESTGATRELSQTRSLFGVLDLRSGKIKTRAELDRETYFGEGITFLDGKVFQLTYTTRVGFIYDAKTFKRLGQFTLPGAEGWGLTTDGTHLIMSDGSNKLYYLDPKTQYVVKTLNVTEKGYAKEELNELEYIKGFIYANIWNTNTIVKIDPANGEVRGLIDLSSLAADARGKYRNSLEMNGIAYDSTKDLVYVTGKMWPTLYGIKISH